MPLQFLVERVQHTFSGNVLDTEYDATVVDIRKSDDIYEFRIKYDKTSNMPWLPLWLEYQENRIKCIRLCKGSGRLHFLTHVY